MFHKHCTYLKVLTKKIIHCLFFVNFIFQLNFEVDLVIET